MNWKMIFTIYIQSGEERIELARYKITDVENIKQLLSRVFEAQNLILDEEDIKLIDSIKYEKRFGDFPVVAPKWD